MKHRAGGGREQGLGAGNGLVVNLNFEFKIMSLQININFVLILVLNQNQLLFYLSFLPLSWVGTNLCAARGGSDQQTGPAVK